MRARRLRVARRRAEKFATMDQPLIAAQTQQFDVKTWAKACSLRTFPWVRWLPAYDWKGDFMRDVIAGVTVGVMAVPQAMSYATVAELPPVFGLYNAFVGLLPYPFFGTSPHLISGPTAVMSILVGGVIPSSIGNGTVTPCDLPHGFSPKPGINVPEDWQQGDQCPERIGLALLLAFVAGAFQIILGSLRLGFLVDLVAEPVVTGFTSGAAFLIASTQFHHFFGIDKCSKLKGPGEVCDAAHYTAQDPCECLFVEKVQATYDQFDKISWSTVAYGIVCLIILWVFQNPLNKALPKKYKLFAKLGPFLIVVGSIIFVVATLEAHVHEDNHISSSDINSSGSWAPSPPPSTHLKPSNFMKHTTWAKHDPKGTRGILVIGEICSKSGFACLPVPNSPFTMKYCPQDTEHDGKERKFCEGDEQTIDFKDFKALIGPAILVAFIGYMESMTIAKTVAKLRAKAKDTGSFNLKLDPSQEFVALGMCNLAVSQLSGYPVTGSFSRTSVNADSGARSPFASLICALVVGAALVLFTKQLQFLPKTVLSAIVLISIAKLIDVEEAKFLFRVCKRDFIVFCVIFFATLLLAVEYALLVGIVFNWVLYLAQSNKMQVTVLGRRRGDSNGVHVDVMANGVADSENHVTVVKVMDDMSFANAPIIRATIEDVASALPDTAVVVVDFSCVTLIDGSGIHALSGITSDLGVIGARLRETLEKAAKNKEELQVGKGRWDTSSRPDSQAEVTVAQPTARYSTLPYAVNFCCIPWHTSLRPLAPLCHTDGGPG
jgi:MFS superfamily sulfate permease-like transporter